jgi:hypothetical protein
VVLPDEKLGHLMDILHYLAVRICEQAEAQVVTGVRRSCRMSSAHLRVYNEEVLAPGDIREEKVSEQRSAEGDHGHSTS